MLAFLADERLTHEIAEQIVRKRSDIRAESILRWRGASLRRTVDEAILAVALEAGLTLVTYDQKTIPPILAAPAAEGSHYGGVVFVDNRTIGSDDIGGLVRALIDLHDRFDALGMTDVVMFLNAIR